MFVFAARSVADFRPQTGSFLDSTSTMGFGVKVHFLLSKRLAEQMLDHVWNHYTLTVTCPRRFMGRSVCMFPRNFPCTTWEGCSQVFSSANAINQTTCVSRVHALTVKPLFEARGGSYESGERVCEHVSVLAISLLTGAAALRLI